MRRIFLFVLAGAVAFSVYGCMTIQENPVTGNRRALGYTWEQEVQIGKEADAQIIAEYGIYDDATVANYVTKVSEAVLANSHMRRDGTSSQFANTPFTFRVLNSPVVNAFALPGGFVYVTRGLMTHLNNEAQLAVVIGHEIGHVAARHASQRAFEQQAGQLALIGGAVLGESLGLPGGDILNLGSQAAQLLFLRYSRDNERESDKLGVEYSAYTGYDASEGSEFFVSLKRLTDESGGGGLPSHLSSHPDPGDREQAIKRMSAEWEAKGLTQEKVGEGDYLNLINNMILGENPREGFTKNNVFYHPDLKFQFPVPSNWITINETSQVVLVQKDQKAVMIIQIASGKTPQAAVEEIGKSEGMVQVSANAITVNGLNGYQMITSATTQEGAKYGFNIYGISFQNNTYLIAGYSTEADFATYRSQFDNTARGFRQLTDSAILNVKPARIKLVTVDRDTRFADLLPNTIPLDMTREEMAILNQVSLDTIIPRGTRVKIPVQ